MILKEFIYKVGSLIKNIGIKKNPKVTEPSLPPTATSGKEITQPKQADITFYVKKRSEHLYEVSSKEFIGLKGRGVTAEQALDNLMQIMNEKIDVMVKNTLITSLHKEEINKKYKKLVDKFYAKYIEKSWTGKLKRKLASILHIKPRYSGKTLEVNISLKKPLTTETMLSKMFTREIPQFNLAKLPYPRLDKKLYNPAIPGLGAEENKVYLKTQQNSEEIPIQMLIDNEGNSLDDAFSFGIIVNLN